MPLQAWGASAPGRVGERRGTASMCRCGVSTSVWAAWGSGRGFFFSPTPKQEEGREEAGFSLQAPRSAGRHEGTPRTVSVRAHLRLHREQQHTTSPIATTPPTSAAAVPADTHAPLPTSPPASPDRRRDVGAGRGQGLPPPAHVDAGDRLHDHPRRHLLVAALLEAQRHRAGGVAFGGVAAAV